MGCPSLHGTLCHITRQFEALTAKRCRGSGVGGARRDVVGRSANGSNGSSGPKTEDCNALDSAKGGKNISHRELCSPLDADGKSMADDAREIVVDEDGGPSAAEGEQDSS